MTFYAICKSAGQSGVSCISGQVLRPASSPPRGLYIATCTSLVCRAPESFALGASEQQRRLPRSNLTDGSAEERSGQVSRSAGLRNCEWCLFRRVGRRVKRVQDVETYRFDSSAARRYVCLGRGLDLDCTGLDSLGLLVWLAVRRQASITVLSQQASKQQAGNEQQAALRWCTAVQ